MSVYYIRRHGDQSVTPMQKAYNGCRQLHLYLSLFNKINALFLYSIKMVAIFIAVSHGFFAIRYFDRNAFLGIYNLYLCVNAQIAYCLTFQRAFRIPLGFIRCKQEICANIHTNQIMKKQIVAALASVPPVAIKVGSFHEVERNSTLIFMHFVVSQMVGLLIAFR